MNKILKTSLLFYLLTLQINSQEISTTEAIKNRIFIVSETFKSELFFKKAVSSFLKKKWDSTLIYSQKQIITSKNKSLKDFSHFLRGYSFRKKKLFKEAEKEYSLVSKKNAFYNSAKTFLGELALQQKQFKKALSYFQNLTKLSKKDYKFIKKSTIIHNLGLCYLHLNNFSKAEEYLKESLTIKEQQKDTIKLIGAYGDLAGLYYEQYKDDLAITNFEKAYKLARKTNHFQLRVNTSDNMAVVEENKKDYKKALTYRKEMEQWKDSLNDQNKIYAVAQAEKEFAVKEKQKEVNILQIENKLKETQRNLFIYAAIGLLLLLGVGLYFYREKVKANTIIAAQKENLDALNATKDKLFSIVSHDLRSSVNALKTSNSSLLDNLASKNIPVLENLLQKNSTIVNGAYSLLDNLLNWALLQTEQGYFNIDKLRLFFITEQVSYNYKPLLVQKELSFENTVAKKDVVFADQESLKIVLRNLLDNAIKFSEPNGSIKIYSKNTNDEEYCHLIVEDNGLGMSEATRLRLLSDSQLLAKKENEDIIGTGLGMQLCKSMIQKNNGKFNIESELGKGTKMIVSLPKTSV